MSGMEGCKRRYRVRGYSNEMHSRMKTPLNPINGMPRADLMQDDGMLPYIMLSLLS